MLKHLNPILSEYTENMHLLLEKLEDAECDQEAIIMTLDSIKELADDELEAMLAYMDELKAQQTFVDEKAKKLAEQAKHLGNKHDLMKDFIAGHLKATGQTEAKRLGVYTVSFRKGSEVVKVDEQLLPKEYWVEQPPVPMGKNDLKKLLKEGKTIDGVSLERTESTLQIK